MKVQHDPPDLVELDAGLGRVVRARAPPHDVLLLLVAEAPRQSRRAAGQQQQHDEGERDGGDALDQEDPSPGSPPVGPVEVLGDGVGDEPVEGARYRGHGGHDGASALWQLAYSYLSENGRLLRSIF